MDNYFDKLLSRPIGPSLAHILLEDFLAEAYQPPLVARLYLTQS